MPVVQNTYNLRIGNLREGQIADTTTCDVDTYVVETTAGIGFGVAVKRGANAGGCAIGVDGAGATPFNVTNFLGVTVRDRTRAAADDDEYKQNSHANVLFRGDVVVKTGSAVTLASAVTVAEGTGVFGAGTASATVHAVPNARWLTAGASGTLQKLRLGQHPQT